MKKKLSFISLLMIILVSCKDIRKEYYEGGAIEAEIEYKNDVRNGKSIIYYPNGNIKQEGFYLDDKEEGIFKDYYDTGELKIEVLFKEGKQEGVLKEYYRNGILKSTQSFINGIPDGVNVFYYENGQIKLESYVNGSETYYYTKYDSLGNWLDEYRYIEVDYKDTLMLSEETKFKIKIYGPEVSGQDTNILLFLDIYAQNPKVKKGIDILVTEMFLPLESNNYTYTYTPIKTGMLGFSGLIITNPKNKKRKSHRIEPTEFYVRDNN